MSTPLPYLDLECVSWSDKPDIGWHQLCYGVCYYYYILMLEKDSHLEVLTKIFRGASCDCRPSGFPCGLDFSLGCRSNINWFVLSYVVLSWSLQQFYVWVNDSKVLIATAMSNTQSNFGWPFWSLFLVWYCNIDFLLKEMYVWRCRERGNAGSTGHLMFTTGLPLMLVLFFIASLYIQIMYVVTPPPLLEWQAVEHFHVSTAYTHWQNTCKLAMWISGNCHCA